MNAALLSPCRRAGRRTVRPARHLSTRCPRHQHTRVRQTRGSRPLLSGHSPAGVRRLPLRRKAAPQRQVLLLVRSGSEAGVDAGGCSATRAVARCACRSRRIGPPASTSTTPQPRQSRAVGRSGQSVRRSTMPRNPRLAGRPARYCAGPPQNRACEFPRIRLKQALMAGRRAEVPGRCSWRVWDGGQPCPACGHRFDDRDRRAGARRPLLPVGWGLWLLVRRRAGPCRSDSIRPGL